MIDLPELVSDLIRIDTSATGGEASTAIELLADLLDSAGIAPSVLVADPERPILIATVPGTGKAPPLLLQAHVDVVGADGSSWTRDPFGGEIVDGWIWGRGALDMKGPLAMMVDAVISLASGPAPAGDIIFCVVSDEETGGTVGAGHLVRERSDLLDGVRIALGEFGGFSYRFGGAKFSPIQVSERTGVPLEITFHGEGGHGSLGVTDGVMGKLGAALVALELGHLEFRLTPTARAMLEAMAPHVSSVHRFAIRRLLDPRTGRATYAAIRNRLGPIASILSPTATATKVNAGRASNVVPSSARLSVDGRMLPGMTVDELIADIATLLGVECDIRALGESPAMPLEPDMSLFPLLVSAIGTMDPTAVAIPYLSPAATDARWFSRLGIQCYGFTPMLLPTGFDFSATVHGADERIPIDTLQPGSDALLDVLSRYGRAGASA